MEIFYSQRVHKAFNEIRFLKQDKNRQAIKPPTPWHSRHSQEERESVSFSLGKKEKKEKGRREEGKEKEEEGQI